MKTGAGNPLAVAAPETSAGGRTEPTLAMRRVAGRATDQTDRLISRLVLCQDF